MDDRRKSDRTPVQRANATSRVGRAAIFGVTNLETDKLIGHMVDISPSGIQISTQTSIEVQTELNLRLRLPEVMEGSIFVVLNGECVWCRPGSGDETFAAGFKITAITPRNVERIAALMGALGKNVVSVVS